MIEAGRYLDRFVAEKVMGWSYDAAFESAPPYSTDITAAWQVVEKIKSREKYPEQFYTQFTLMEDRYSGVYSKGKWLCSFEARPHQFDDGPWSGDIECMGYWEENRWGISAADTAPLAICLAALKAVGYDKEEA